jgi:HlyD family secretion protein
MSSRKSGFRPIHLIGVLVVLGSVAWYGRARGGWFASSKVEVIRGAKVQRGPLRISVIERGNLKAADSVSLKSEIEGQTTILYLHPEGEVVEEGTLLVELDATELIDRRVQQEITVRNANAAFVKSSQNLKIQESENASDIAKAEQALDFARQDLEKYREGDKVLAEERAKEQIILGDEEHTRAKEKLEWSERLAKKGFLTNTELEADRLSLTSAKIKLDQAKREQEILVQYEIPRQVAELQANLAEAHRELERVNLQAEARLVDFKADKETNQAELALEEETLAKYKRQIERAKIYAPKRGMVVYSQGNGDGRGRNSEPMQEGSTIRERQEIITIPNPGGMVAQASLHESVLKQVSVGQPVMVKVDALGTTTFQGQVSFVAVLPDQQSWFANPNVRLYRTDIQIFNTSPEMRPGMSAAIEILVEDITDALYVPVQTVFRHKGGNICFVNDGTSVKATDVEIGQYNDKWVQVSSGLEEGQTVLMSPPTNFQLESEVHEAEQEAMPFLPGAAPGTGVNGGGQSGVEASLSSTPEAGQPDLERFRNMSDAERKAAMEEFRGEGGPGLDNRRDNRRSPGERVGGERRGGPGGGGEQPVGSESETRKPGS